MPASKKPLPLRPCAVCGRPFSPPRRDGVTCNPTCRAERKRQMAALWYEAHAERCKAAVTARRRRKKQ